MEMQIRELVPKAAGEMQWNGIEWKTYSLRLKWWSRRRFIWFLHMSVVGWLLCRLEIIMIKCLILYFVINDCGSFLRDFLNNLLFDDWRNVITCNDKVRRSLRKVLVRVIYFRHTERNYWGSIITDFAEFKRLRTASFPRLENLQVIVMWWCNDAIHWWPYFNDLAPLNLFQT